MAKDGNLTESERARAERQAERLRANLQRRKAQQRARKQETSDESSILPEGIVPSDSGPEKA